MTAGTVGTAERIAAATAMNTAPNTRWLRNPIDLAVAPTMKPLATIIS